MDDIWKKNYWCHHDVYANLSSCVMCYMMQNNYRKKRIQKIREKRFNPLKVVMFFSKYYEIKIFIYKE